ncbi:MFS transporter, partial [Bacillus velezensis]
FFLYITGSIYWAVIHDVVDQRNVGSVGGFMHFLANTAGIIGPALTGFIADKSGSFSGAVLLAGGLAVLASAAVIRFVRPIIIQTASEDKKDTIPYS